MNSEWIEFNGNERPVDGDVWVDYKLENGLVVQHMLAGSFIWKKTKYSSDIIAYRLSTEE